MIRRRMPVSLKFDKTVEYSKDDGNNWITLDQNTLIEIPEEDLSSGKIMVRSTEDVSELNIDMLEFNKRRFEFINIKNGKSLTTLNEVFQYSIIDKVRINNLINIGDTTRAFKDSTLKTLFIGYMPNVTNLYDMFFRAKINLMSNFIFGNKDSSVLNAGYLFEYADIKLIGDIIFKGKSIHNSKGMFYNSNIDFFPYIDICLEEGNVDTAEYRHSGLFVGCKSKYILEGNITALNIDSSSNGSYTDQVGYSNNDVNLGFMSKTDLHFTGLTLNLYIYDDSGDSDKYKYTFTNSSNLKYPFKVLRLQNSPITRDLSSSLSGTQISSNVTNYERIDDNYGYLEIPYWMPDVIELESYITQNVIGATGILTKDFYLEIIKNDISLKAKDIQRFDGTDWDSYNNNYGSSFIAGSRNGYRLFKIQDEVKIYNPTGALESTFTVQSANLQMATFSADGLKVYLLKATKYDEQTGGTQQLEASYDVYDSITGTILEQNVQINLEENLEVVGIYKPYDDSNLQIVMRKWDDDGNGNIVEINSVIRAFNNGIIKKEISLSDKVNLVSQNYWEDNEFMCINISTGKCIRCFGK
jgi:hypothetical protein